jgi:hypothetical protein
VTLASLAAPLFFAVATSAPAPADDRPPPPAMPAPPPETRAGPHVVFAEALGNGLFYTVNYEHIFDSIHLGLRVGASYFTHSVSTYGGSGNLVFVSFPLVASYYLGSTEHKVQLGLGATILYLDVGTDSQHTKFEGDRAGAGLAATAVIGYRYLPKGRGISFGLGFTPLLRPGRFLPWGGLNVGYAF